MHKIHISPGLLLLLLFFPVFSELRAEMQPGPGIGQASLHLPGEISVSSVFPRTVAGFPPVLYQENDEGLLLILAAEAGNADSVLVLLELGLDVNRPTTDGVTALMYAASNGHLDVVRMLVENDADINAIPFNGVTALSGAVLNDHYETALFLLQQDADTGIPDNEGITPLLYAVAYDNFDLTELLLMFGGDPLHRDLEGATALHAAAIYAQPDIAWLLLDYGAAVDAIDNFGFTPLMMAVQLGRAEMAGYLLEVGADIHLMTRDNMSVLAIAVANNRLEIAEKLIEMGADPKVRISYSDNLMNLARWTENERMISLIENQGIRANILPAFRTMRLSVNALFNAGDFFNGPQASFEDEKYNLLFTAGWYTRPVRRAVLLDYDNDWFDQLWEQRHLFFGSLHKLFPMRYTIGLNEDGFYAGINFMHSSGRYWGTYRYPGSRWHFVPSAGYYKAGSWWYYNIGYEYIQLDVLEKSPHRITFGLGIRFNIIRDPVIYRTTYW